MTLNSYRVLIVDDNPTFVKTLSMLVKDILGSKLTKLEFAYNGIDAVEKAFRNEPYNIIFMDVNMPEMNGIMATKLISQELYRGTKVVGLSFNRDLQTVSEMISSGAINYIYKGSLTVETLEKVFEI